MPNPTVGPPAGAALRASQASPERVRRSVSTGPSAIRWCGAARVTSTVTTSPGRTSSAAGGGEVHEPVVGPATREPVRGGVLAALALGDHQLDAAADQALVLVPRDVVDERGEPFVAVLDRLGGHLVVHRRRRASRARGVDERERAGEPRPAHDLHGLEEVVLGLAREADDDVGRDRGVGHRRADPVDDAEVALLAVGPAHRPQDPVGARLQGHVQLRHHVGRLGHGVDDVVGELRRVRRREPHPFEPVDLAAGPEQLGERLPVAELDAVRVDVLPQQRHLTDALGDQRLDLGEDLTGPAVLLLAAQ